MEAEIYAKKTKERGLNVQLHIVKGGHEFKSIKGRNDIINKALK